MSTAEYWREYRRKNAAKVKKHQRAYYDRNKALVIQRAGESRSRRCAEDPKHLRRRNLKTQYDLSLEDYECLAYAQDNLCAVCRRPETAKGGPGGGTRPLAVDHDHRTGEVRALLCQKCNLALGYVDDDILVLRAMITYLEAHSNG